MAKTYQYTDDGYYAGEAEDYGILPNNATYTAPPAAQDGFVHRWTGTSWEQVEDHKGREGYVNGEPFTVKDFGPLPDGWSDTPPPPTDEYLRQQHIIEIKATLTEIDARSARPLRAMLLDLRNGIDPSVEDEAELAVCEAEAIELRADLAGLE